MLGLLTRPLATLQLRREKHRSIEKQKGKLLKKKQQDRFVLPNKRHTGKADQAHPVVDGTSNRTLQTVDTWFTSATEDHSVSSLPAADNDHSRCTFPPLHTRHPALDNQDFDELLNRSRGWLFDPSQSATFPSTPHHRDREFTKAMGQTDFEKFIFRPLTNPGPRLG